MNEKQEQYLKEWIKEHSFKVPDESDWGEHECVSTAGLENLIKNIIKLN